MPKPHAPLKFSGDFRTYLRRFEPTEKLAVDNLYESCEKHGADVEQILTSFAGIPLKVMENLAEEFSHNPTRRSPNLDLMLFRDPGAVYPVYHAFAKHKFMMEQGLTLQEAKEKANRCVRDARAESAKYYKIYGQPELSKTKGEVQPVPWWAKIRLLKNGLPSDFANEAFVNEFLRTLKEKKQYRLVDRLHVLFDLKPRGLSRTETLKDRLTRAFQTPVGEKSGKTVYDALPVREGTLESQMLHHMMMESPEKVKFTHAQVYQKHATRQPAYRLANWAESIARSLGQNQLAEKMANWKKKKDEQIDEHISRTDAAIDQYHDTFHRDFQIRVDHSVGRSTKKTPSPFHFE